MGLASEAGRWVWCGPPHLDDGDLAAVDHLPEGSLGLVAERAVALAEHDDLQRPRNHQPA